MIASYQATQIHVGLECEHPLFGDYGVGKVVEVQRGPNNGPNAGTNAIVHFPLVDLTVKLRYFELKKPGLKRFNRR